ncbi:Retron-type reverse transcriptase [Desulfonatronum thiosulfatophilum]|uniref:Retron-type reverse transcriptase n=1 Tax=Desulfonatronum thiosulfatophilum TaxID=617002 RepID=A0A1G6A6P5_9BACT|nr:RNA-directed DNA polymerase [Desulfonatronum thiosulfatophilum]SDB04127.1 Retron-type reverse transcriptase [Desulfonatronum thiosulfatophilum]
MKRQGNLWPAITTSENIHAAYLRARRGKAWQRTIQSFEQDIAGNLERVRQSLIRKTFRTSPYNVKTIHEPKKRDIYVLPFAPDRIVQHALMAVVEPIWDRMFIDDSYCCRTGKGIHSGSLRAMQFVRKHKYCLKCDVSKFYPSIQHDVLFGLVQRKIKCPDALWLLRDVIYSTGGGANAPIGNYTSQWFGNLYLHELDMQAKHVWKVRAYLRYCDDFCLFHDDKAVLRDLATKIREFMSERLGLRLSKCDLFPVSRGLDFLGYRHFPDGYVLLRKRTAKKMQRRLRTIPAMLASGRLTLETARSVVASAKGWMRWANTRNLAMAMNVNDLEHTIRMELAKDGSPSVQ